MKQRLGVGPGGRSQDRPAERQGLIDLIGDDPEGLVAGAENAENYLGLPPC
jgi:hypothetical protein